MLLVHHFSHYYSQRCWWMVPKLAGVVINHSPIFSTELKVESEYLFTRVYDDTYLSCSMPTKLVHQIEESYVCYVMNMSMLICRWIQVYFPRWVHDILQNVAESAHVILMRTCQILHLNMRTTNRHATHWDVFIKTVNILFSKVCKVCNVHLDL